MKYFVWAVAFLAPTVWAVDKNAEPSLDGLHREVRLLNEIELQAELSKIGDEFVIRDATEDVDEAVTIFEKLWLIGKKIYPLIKDGEAAMNVRTQRWSVLPEGVVEPASLTNWQAPKFLGFELAYKNTYGITVTRVRYVATYAYGGKHNGRGAYLTHLTVVPSSILVHWGFKLSVDMEAKEALNMGSVEDPVAGFGFDIKVHLYSQLAGIRISEALDTIHVFMDGTGRSKISN